MTVRRLIVLLALAAFAAAPARASAPGHAWGTGVVTGTHCSGGQIAIAGSNPSGLNWVFDVTVICQTAAPKHLVIPGMWDANVGGNVNGFSPLGTLNLGKAPACDTVNNNVSIAVGMIGSAAAIGKISLARDCY